MTMTRGESASVGTLRYIAGAQEEYKEKHGVWATSIKMMVDDQKDEYLESLFRASNEFDGDGAIQPYGGYLFKMIVEDKRWIILGWPSRYKDSGLLTYCLKPSGEQLQIDAENIHETISNIADVDKVDWEEFDF